ncbi:MAG: type II toxin-antitoxin system HicB family antitoxin [Steroidobacteraceae bacterium]
MRHPIAIETGDAKHAFGAVVPDLPGCFSAGDTLDDALIHAREAILLHLEGLLDDGTAFPAPTSIRQLQKNSSHHRRFDRYP